MVLAVAAGPLRASSTSLPAGPPSESAGRAKTIEEGLELTEKERIILDAVRDRTRQCHETGLYMMLAKTARLPEPSEDDLAGLDRPAYRNLLRSPQRYRGRPIRLTVQVQSIRRLAPGKGLSFSRFWPQDKPIWGMDCLNADAKDPYLQPLRVFTTADPSELLPSPKQLDEDGTGYYRGKGPKVELVGVLYKVYTAMSRGDERRPQELRDYPIVLAWYLLPEAKLHGTPMGMLPVMVMFAIILVLAGLFIYLRRLTARQRRTDRTKYRSLRGPAGPAAE